MTQRILVVEDQEDNRIILRDLLASAGYDVIEALNGRDGVGLAESEKPDLTRLQPVGCEAEVLRAVLRERDRRRARGQRGQDNQDAALRLQRQVQEIADRSD